MLHWFWLNLANSTNWTKDKQNGKKTRMDAIGEFAQIIQVKFYLIFKIIMYL